MEDQKVNKMTIKKLKEQLSQLPEHYEIKGIIMDSDFVELELTDIIQGRDEDNELQEEFLLTMDFIIPEEKILTQEEMDNLPKFLL